MRGRSKVARIGVARKRIPQHIDEYLRRGLRGRRVQRGDAERPPQVIADQAGLAVRFEQAVDRDVLLEPKLHALQRLHEANGAQAFADRDFAQREQAAEQPERRGQPQRAQREAVRVAQLERHAQHRIRRNADEPHQPEQLGVRADQDVLSVVQVAAVRVHAPRPPSRDRTCLEDDDALARGSQSDRRGHAGVASADDRYAVIQVFQEIQNLRKGVNEVRCVSTRNPSRSISASSWR
jgi:hypothetical protein